MVGVGVLLISPEMGPVARDAGVLRGDALAALAFEQPGGRPRDVFEEKRTTGTGGQVSDVQFATKGTCKPKRKYQDVMANKAQAARACVRDERFSTHMHTFCNTERRHPALCQESASD